MQRWLPIGALGLAAATGCSNTSVISNTNNFSRAGDVDFVCIDVPSNTARPLAECGLNPSSNAPTGDGTKHLHAVVTQSLRGELAVVDLAATAGVALIDNSPGVPGYNFLPVGPFPEALATDVRSGTTPSSVWVASGGGRRIERVDVRALRRDPRVPSEVPPVTGLELPGPPTDLALDVNGTTVTLFATVPSLGMVVAVDVTDPLAPRIAETFVVGGGSDADAGVTGVEGRARALTLDRRTHRLYVADGVAPAVHVLEAGPLREVGQVAMGVSTRALALSGWTRQRTACPDAAADPDHCARARYLYGIAADDGTVVAYDLVRGARVQANLLPAPNAVGRRIVPTLPVDRVPLTAPATSIIPLNTADYVEEADPADPSGVIVRANAPCEAAPCATSDTAPGTLRGVFMAVVSRDGSLTFLDVDDYDAACREALCPGNATTQAAYRFVRHAPRAGVVLTQPPRLTASPNLSGLLRGTERAALTDLNAAPMVACAAERTRQSPSTCDALSNYGVELTRREDFSAMVSVADPYVARNEVWSFTYEGVLPGLDQGGGALSVDPEGRLRLDLPGAAFCVRGALANSRARDVVSLASDPAPLPADADLCRATFGVEQSAQNRDFVIERAFNGHLELRDGAVAPALVARCFPQATRFQVRAAGQWLALGTSSGFLSAVRADSTTGECVVDEARQAEQDRYAARCLLTRAPLAMRPASCPAGRACTGGVDAMGAARATLAPVFANPFFCLQLYPALTRPMGSQVDVAAPIPRETQVAFSITGAYEPFRATVGNLPLRVRWVPTVQRLFIVDTQSSGLLEYRTNPFTAGRQFN